MNYTNKQKKPDFTIEFKQSVVKLVLISKELRLGEAGVMT